MADNYLEKRYEKVFGEQSGLKRTNLHPSLDTLFLKNRSYRGYDKSCIVNRRQLELIVSVNAKIASGMNAQRLRFRIVTKDEGADRILPLIRLGAALPELHLPFPGTEPEAFIVVCSTCAENPVVDIDLGISLQSMLLKAVDLGLGGIIVRNYDKDALKKLLDLPLDPIAVLAIGKPAEKVELVTVRAGENLSYRREDGVHVVPKIAVEDLFV